MAGDGVTEILERNKRGELWVRAQNVMKGYWRNPKATQETKTQDGWLRTGDICFVDDEGKFHVVDRMKVSSDHAISPRKAFCPIMFDADNGLPQELIKVKGNQVAPAELEALLLEHPAIADVAVIGVTV